MKSVREITTYKWIIKKSEFICTLIPCNDETAIDNIIKEYQEKYQFTWTGLLGFSDAYGLAVRKEIAEQYNLKLIQI